MKNKKQLTNEQMAMRVSIVTVIGNIVLALFKFIAGVLSLSIAMISDAIHSASDMFSTIVVMIGIKMSSKKNDNDHNYGHDRLECVSAIILSVILAVTGAGIGIGAVSALLSGDFENASLQFTTLALVAAIVSIFSKEAMYWYTRKVGKKINSGALMADAWHHRSDALSSIGSLIGILGMRFGFPILDKIAGIVICIFILKVSLDIFKDAIGKMTDKACDDKTQASLVETAESVEGVIKVDLIRTRLFADKIYVDIEISADKTLTILNGHEIAQCVHDKIENNFPTVKHCMVHVNPSL